MKTRIIQTRFWDDLFVSNADMVTQHLYIFLLTSQYINISGIFQLPENKIKFEAKLTDKQFEDAKINLEANGKVFFKEGWVYVTNAGKNNNYRRSPSNEIAYEREVSLVPQYIKDYFDSSVDSTVHSNQQPEIRNKKSTIINKKEIEKKKFSTLEEITPSVIQEVAEKYEVPVDFVNKKLDDLENWLEEKPSRGKGRNLRRTLMTWVSRDKEDSGKKRYGRGGAVDLRTDDGTN